MSETDNQTAQDLAGEIEALRDRQDRLEEENEQLRKQNEELGKTVQQLQANQGIDLPKPSRRQMLKAGGAGLATLLFGGAATGNVAAFDGDSDPEIGSDSFRYDWYLDSLDANMVNTDGLNIGGHNTVSEVEYGTFSFSQTVSAASDDGWDTAQKITKTVSFSTSFSSAPIIYFQKFDGRGTASVINTSTSDFELRFGNRTTLSYTPAGGSDVVYHAVVF
jgi:TolA-binding protein